MPKVILYRLLQFPLILAVIYLLTFLLAWVAPGDPFSGDRVVDPVVLENLRKRYHADSPWQFLYHYPKNILTTGDFGRSMQYKEWSVTDIIKSSLPVSVTLGFFALLLAVFIGVGIGTLAAVKRGGVLDWSSLTVALLGVSLPSFVVAALLLMLGAWARFLPVGWGGIKNLVVPGFSLALLPMAYIARLTRVS